MPGNVLVDDIEAEEAPPQPSSWWLTGLGAIVVVVLVLLTGQPDSAPAPVNVTVPEVVVPEDRWTPVELPGTGRLTDIAAADDGYVAVGEGPQIWRSADGSTWEWSTAPDMPNGALQAVTPFADGMVAVGFASPDGVIRQATVWRSRGGTTWEQVNLPVGPPSGLEGITAAGGRVVAWGWKGSSGDFAPEAEPLLLISDDGSQWREIEMAERLHISSVTSLEGKWYASGFTIGRAALWSSPDLERWEQVPTDEMLFGWNITRVTHDGSLVADLVGLDEEGFRQWRQQDDGSWVAMEEQPGDSFNVVTVGGDEYGVGGGRLWAKEADAWTQIDLEGEVTAAADGVAVGAYRQQPTIWTADADAEVEVEMAADGRWETFIDLGEETYVGAWPVAEGWLVAGETQWWFLDQAGVEPVAPPGPTWTIKEIGDEWVSLPSMHWTSDGVLWEERAQPWTMAGSAQIEAVSAIDGEVLAVGRNHLFLWTVAASADQGRTWSLAQSPRVRPPLWAVVGTPSGFAATAARSRGTDEIVISADGQEWETLAGGTVIVAGGDVPAAMTESGDVLLLDTDERITPPRVDVTGIRRDGDGLVVVADGNLWLGKDEWRRIPVDPPHGVVGAVDPIPLDGRLLAVEIDRKGMRILEWSGD
ncbi:MAG TPA: hypothetical protein VHL52_13305 [Acidimicrobiia bacterium]|nr:hypothetical protein [Acidimicrobiia bacterium]